MVFGTGTEGFDWAMFETGVAEAGLVKLILVLQMVIAPFGGLVLMFRMCCAGILFQLAADMPVDIQGTCGYCEEV